MTTPRLAAGASGFSFKEWKGSFYPGDMKPTGMLAFYGERLPTVEINSTFYRMPEPAVLENWAKSTPKDFRFAIKAPRRITHLSRLKPESTADTVTDLYRRLGALGEKRGPVLFQLPPSLRIDLPRLQEFLGLLPVGHAAAFEFRSESWFSEDVYAALKSANASLCVSERDEKSPTPLVETTTWGYVRLRLENYSDADLQAWGVRLAETNWRQIYVYFMHEPSAPNYAAKLMKHAPP